MSSSPKIHRAWVILVTAMLVYAGSTGIILNCTGVLFQAIRTDLGFRAGDLSLFYTIRSLASSAVMPFLVSIFFKRSSRFVLALSGTLACAGVAMMYFFDQLWQWYIAGVLVGVGTSLTMVVIPVVLNNWFHQRNGFAIGLTMAGSGIAGALFSPFLSSQIAALGWRQAALVMAGVSFVLIVPCTLLFMVSSPEKAGCRPYGDGLEARKDRAGRGVTVPPKGYIFVLGLLCGVAAMGIVQFNNQLPTFAQTVGYTLETGALLTSCCMVGNLVGKLIYGALTDRIGIYHSARIYIGVVCLSLAGFLLLSGSLPALYASAALFGSCYSVSVMSPSLLFLDLYGEDAYKDKLSRMQAINGVLSAFLSALIPYMYDATGSFNIVFVYGLVTMAIAFLLYTYLHRYSKARRTA